MFSYIVGTEMQIPNIGMMQKQLHITSLLSQFVCFSIHISRHETQLQEFCSFRRIVLVLVCL